MIVVLLIAFGLFAGSFSASLITKEINQAYVEGVLKK